MKNQLIKENLGLVYSMAKKLSASTTTPYADLVSAGKMGLLNAARNYAEGKAFKAYAKVWIKSEIVEAIRATSTIAVPDHVNRNLAKLSKAIKELEAEGIRTTNKNLAKKLGFPIGYVEDLKKHLYKVTSLDNNINENQNLSDVIASENIKNPAEEYEDAERSQIFNKILSFLTPEEVKIMSQRYGFNGEEEVVNSSLNAKRKAIMRKIRNNPQVMELVQLMKGE